MQLIDHVREIPFREMDDPPDMVEIDIAFFEGGGESQYGGEGDADNP